MKYHTNKEIPIAFSFLQKQNPEHSSTFMLGKSVKSNPLIGLRLKKSIGVTLHRKQNRKGNARATHFPANAQPMVKIVGNVHGNEAVGRELLIHFAKYMLQAQSTSTEKRDSLAQRAARLLAITDLWILPSMNPDGFDRAKEGKCSRIFVVIAVGFFCNLQSDHIVFNRAVSSITR